jgi:G3E family GTPase
MLPVSIITGFLGSGKTTLLNRLLQHDAFKNSLVIINEFGEVGIDHLLVSAPAENMRLLTNGCLCCEVRGDMVDTLMDVSLKRARGEIPVFDRILIETTGLADPVPIVQTIVADRELGALYHLDTVVSVVDAVHVLQQLTTQSEICKQIAVADVLLLSKSDLVSPDVLPGMEAAVREINGGAQLFHVRYGEIAPELLFNHGSLDRHAQLASLQRWLNLGPGGERSEGEAVSHASHATDIRTYTLFHEGRVSRPGLATWLSMLASFKGPQLLRVKGIVNVDGDPHIIHAVQTVIHETVQLDAWPTSDRRTRIVFIVRGLECAALESTFAAFDMPDTLGANVRQIDPAAYAQFVKAARHFI